MADDAQHLALIQANGFRPDALESNRSGRLTDQQTRELRSKRFARGTALVVIGIICLVFGAWDLLSGHPESSEGGRGGAYLLLVGGVVLVALRFSDFGRSYAAEVGAGRVASVDGFIRIRHSSGGGESGTHHSYYYKIEGREFQTTEEGAALVNPQSRYRVYFVANTDIMINIECLGSLFVAGTQAGAHLKENDVAAIFGEPMRAVSEKSATGSAAMPGMVISSFESTTSKLRVIVGFLLGAQDSSIVSFYRRFLASGPESRAVTGLGDEATFSRGQLLVRRGDIFLMIIIMSFESQRDSEHLLDMERRLAVLALNSLEG